MINNLFDEFITKLGFPLQGVVHAVMRLGF